MGTVWGGGLFRRCSCLQLIATSSHPIEIFQILIPSLIPNCRRYPPGEVVGGAAHTLFFWNKKKHTALPSTQWVGEGRSPPNCCVAHGDLASQRSDFQAMARQRPLRLKLGNVLARRLPPPSSPWLWSARGQKR